MHDLPPFHRHHHKIPFRNGGEETITLCPWCHAKAHEKMGEENIGRLIRGSIKSWQETRIKEILYKAQKMGKVIEPV